MTNFVGTPRILRITLLVAIETNNLHIVKTCLFLGHIFWIQWVPLDHLACIRNGLVVKGRSTNQPPQPPPQDLCGFPSFLKNVRAFS